MAKEKIGLEDLQLILQKNGLKNDAILKIIKDAQEQLVADKEEKDKEKREVEKKRWVLLVGDPEGVLDDVELTGYALQINESDSEYDVVKKLNQMAREYNRSKRGRKDPVKSVTEVCEVVPAKALKEVGVWVKHREAAFVLTTDNILEQNRKD
ncbi:MAG: hypothetical protein K6B46_01235 [Opitutales bacterium]|nr:hypothetical protein [Opitutales bacterium]